MRGVLPAAPAAAAGTGASAEERAVEQDGAAAAVEEQEAEVAVEGEDSQAAGGAGPLEGLRFWHPHGVLGLPSPSSPKTKGELPETGEGSSGRMTPADFARNRARRRRAADDVPRAMRGLKGLQEAA